MGKIIFQILLWVAISIGLVILFNHYQNYEIKITLLFPFVFLVLVLFKLRKKRTDSFILDSKYILVYPVILFFCGMVWVIVGLHLITDKNSWASLLIAIGPALALQAAAGVLSGVSLYRRLESAKNEK
jgi:apolipoprotein N-acyltransferase